MPIISVVGRKQRKTRILVAALYVVLTTGALSMVYPFLLMFSTSFTSPVDQNEFKIIPRYIYNDAVLYRKYVESKYNEDIVKYNIWFGTDYASFEELETPGHVNRRLVAVWREFAASLPMDYLMLGHSFNLSKITPEITTEYRAFARQRFGGDLEELNRIYKEANENWMEVQIPAEDWTQRSFAPEQTLKYREFLKFKRQRPQRYLITVSADGLFQEFLRLKYGDLDKVNRALGTSYRSKLEIHLAERMPTGATGEEWEAFVRREGPVHFVEIERGAADAFRVFMRRKYGTLDAYNHAHEAAALRFDEVSAAPRAPSGGIPLVDWIEFLESAAPVEYIRLRTSEVLFQEALARKYRDIGQVNRALGTDFASFSAVKPPYEANDWLELLEDRRAIRREFVVRNYREVIDYIALHGRALLNTAILCIGLIAGTLIVNPLCAYALSRFNLRSTYKILLFLLATMAFPAEVSAIPSFLLIKDLHLLGTYWAIILPSVANGYSIFLLKGFFDSLPKELYEAAMMDGATEMQMYWKITLQLSKPVLAVIALWTFTAAYGSFMWAFLVLQNPEMWTLMVWLYQMQIWAPQFLVYAGLVLAAIPTLTVFILCQNVIMRGIIVPSEK